MTSQGQIATQTAALVARNHPARRAFTYLYMAQATQQEAVQEVCHEAIGSNQEAYMRRV